jgi:hypothetical protein
MQRAGGSFVFPGTRNEKAAFNSLPKAWERILALSYRTLPLTLSGISFASVADDLGYTEATIGAMLGHSGGGTTRKYIHKLDPALIAAADRVAEHIACFMEGSQVSADVVPLHRTGE